MRAVMIMIMNWLLKNSEMRRMRQFKRNCLDHNQTRLKPKTFPKYDVSFLISSSHGNIEALFFTKE